MPTKNINKFKGEIENYLGNQTNNFDSKIDSAFSSLKVKTYLCTSNIIKKDGWHASHLLFVLIMLPLLKINTIHSFCGKMWSHWSESGKDAFYRFKQKAYRWRTFMYKLNMEIFTGIELEKCPREEQYFVIDDTILQKLGKMMENVSYIFDHNLGRSVLGYCIVALGLFTGKGFYPIDFAYRFSEKRNAKSPEEKIGDPRSISGKRSYEAKHYTKLELALMMIERAVSHGICPGYVLFDSWYAWPVFIYGIRKLADKSMHVICRLKNSNVKYLYKGKEYKLSELYQKVKNGFKKDKRTGLSLKRVKVKIVGYGEESVIVLCKGYKEPEEDAIKGKKKKKEPKWTAFLSTNTALHSSTIIIKYTKRWPVEVCFKECKQMLALGKDQSNSFDAQVFATTASFIRYNLLNYLNHKENYETLGSLFEHLADDYAVITYSQRLWGFFRELFHISIKTIFELFNIDDDFQSYLNALNEGITASTPIRGCET